MRIAKSIADIQVRGHVTDTVAIGVKIEALRRLECTAISDGPAAYEANESQMTLDGSYKVVIDVIGETGLRAQCGVNGFRVQVQFGFI